MAWLWNNNSLKYRKNGSTKSLIYLQDYVNDINPSYISSSVRSNFLGINKGGSIIKVPLIKTGNITSGSPYYPWRDCNINVFHNGAQCKPMLNKSAVFFNISGSSSTHSTSQYGMQATQYVSVSYSVLTKLPVFVTVKLTIRDNLSGNSTTKTNTLKAGGFTSSVSDSCSYDFYGPSGPSGTISFTVTVSLQTGYYNNIGYSGTVFNTNVYGKISAYPEFWMDRSNG